MLVPLGCLLLAACANRSLPSTTDGAAAPDVEPDLLPCPASQLICHSGGEHTICYCPDAAPPPPPPGSWSCDEAITVCKKLNDNHGLPPGGSNWTCHLATVDGASTWVCHGHTPTGSTPPGGNGWTCPMVKTEPVGDLFRCNRPDGTTEKPPYPGHWVCVKGTPYGGHLCTRKDKPVQKPTLYPAPCKPGERMWCDGLVYDGWGQVECDPATGLWRAKTVNGKQMIDCSESLAGGKVPDTLCACYSFFFNPSCCERIDCVVPPEGAGGQVCAKSAGELCDYCNPMSPECVEPGAKCIVTNASETFCGRECATLPCPPGHTCTTVKLKIGTTKQCIPHDFSCYY